MAPRSRLSGPNSYVFPSETYVLDGPGSLAYGDRGPGTNGGLIAGSDLGGNDIFYGVAGEDAEAYGESDAMSGSARGGDDRFEGAGMGLSDGFDYPTNEFYGEARLMGQSSRGGGDTMNTGVNSYGLLVGDARFMLDSSRGGNDVISGGRAESNWVAGEDFGGEDGIRVRGGINSLFGDAQYIGAEVTDPFIEINSSPASYQYYRIAITGVRDAGEANSVQFSEFVLLDVNGNPISGAIYTSTGDYPSSEGPEKAGDGDLSTKYLDFDEVGSTLYITFASPVPVYGYRLATADDAPERDPISWIIEGSNDNTNWTTLETVSDYAAPTEREVYYGEFVEYFDNNVIGGSDTINGGNAVVTDTLLVDDFNWYNDAGGAFAYNGIFGDAGFMGGHGTGGADQLRGGNASAGGTILDDINDGGGGVFDGEDSQLAAVINEMYGDASVMAHYAAGGVDNIRGGDAQTVNSTAFNLISGDAFWLSPDLTLNQNTKTGADVLRGGDAIGTVTGGDVDLIRSNYINLWPTVTNTIAGDAFSLQEPGFVGEDGPFPSDGNPIPGNIFFDNDTIRGGNLVGQGTYGQVDNYLFGDVGLADASETLNELEVFELSGGEDSIWEGAYVRNPESWFAGLISQGFASVLLYESGAFGNLEFSAADEFASDSDFSSQDGGGIMFGSATTTNTMIAGNDMIYGGQGDGFEKLDGSPFGVSNYLFGDAWGMVADSSETGVLRGGNDQLYAGDTPGTLNYLIGDAFFAFGDNVVGGADRLFSGTGKDVLIGDFYEDDGAQGGADTFVFRTNNNDDFIVDFSVAEGDRIDLTGFTGGGKQRNAPEYADFKTFSSLLASERIYEDDFDGDAINDGVFIDLDLDTGSRGSVFILGATLTAGPNQLTASSFYFP